MTLISIMRGDINGGGFKEGIFMGNFEKVAKLMIVQALFEVSYKMLMVKILNSKKVYFPLIV